MEISRQEPRTFYAAERLVASVTVSTNKQSTAGYQNATKCSTILTIILID